MKRKIFNVKQLNLMRTLVKNAFSEKGQGVADLLRAILDEMESAEEEFDEEAIIAKVQEALKQQNGGEDVPEAVAEFVVKKCAEIKNSLTTAAMNNGKHQLDKKVANAIAMAVLRSNKNDVEQNVCNVMVKNGITGLTFNDVVDFAVVDNWGSSDDLFKKFHFTKYSKFFYTEDDLATASVLAKQWSKTLSGEKLIQSITATPKQITTDFVYKRQQIALSDIDDIDEAGEGANFLAYINEELDRQIINTIIMAIFVGDTINASANRISTFETIGIKTTDDAFTKVFNVTGANFTIEQARTASDAVLNPYGKEKVAVMSQKTLTALATFVYANGGTTIYHSKEEVAGLIGVNDIYVTDIVGNDKLFVCIPDGYWVKEKSTIAVSYATWEKNVMNHQKERNIGGKIHDLFSTAVVKLTASTGN